MGIRRGFVKGRDRVDHVESSKVFERLHAGPRMARGSSTGAA